MNRASPPLEKSNCCIRRLFHHGPLRLRLEEDGSGLLAARSDREGVGCSVAAEEMVEAAERLPPSPESPDR
jgi:hypothetical protein